MSANDEQKPTVELLLKLVEDMTGSLRHQEQINHIFSARLAELYAREDATYALAMSLCPQDEATKEWFRKEHAALFHQAHVKRFIDLCHGIPRDLALSLGPKQPPIDAGAPPPVL